MTRPLDVSNVDDTFGYSCRPLGRSFHLISLDDLLICDCRAPPFISSSLYIYSGHASPRSLHPHGRTHFDNANMTHIITTPLPHFYNHDNHDYDLQTFQHTQPPVSRDYAYTFNMRTQVNEPTSVAEDNSMHPPSGHTRPSGQATQEALIKRRESRFDPMGQDHEEDEEGYGELRHPLRSTNQDNPDETKAGGSFSLPGIKSLLNPSFGKSLSHILRRGVGLTSIERDPAMSSTPYGQSPSLPSLVSSNSPSGSPSTLRTSRYSSLASGSSIGAESQGWWAPDFERDRSNASASRRHVHPALYVDEQDGKRRRSDQPRSTTDMDEQTRMKWAAQSRNASFPTASSDGASTHSSPIMGSMHPPAQPTAAMSRQSRSQQDHVYYDRRPSAVPRSMSSVSGTLTSSFAELSSNERDRERDRQRSSSHPNDMPPPFPSPLGIDRERRFSALQNSNAGEYHNHTLGSSPGEIQRMRHHTATPPEPHRASSYSSDTEMVRPNIQRAARSSLSEMIMAQSGDDRNMSSQGRLSIPTHLQHGSGGPEIGGWHPTRRSSNSSTQSTSAPGVSVTLDSDDGHTPVAQHRHEFRDRDGRRGERERSNPMGGMDVLAESARRVSEEETRRVNGIMMGDHDREGSPKGGGPGGPKYQCAYCTKTFSRPSSLRIHTYSRESTHCPSTRFVVLADITRHWRTSIHMPGTILRPSILCTVEPQTTRQSPPTRSSRWRITTSTT